MSCNDACGFKAVCRMTLLTHISILPDLKELRSSFLLYAKSANHPGRTPGRTHPGGPVMTTACVRARLGDGVSATRRRPSLTDTGGLMLVACVELSDALSDASFGLRLAMSPPSIDIGELMPSLFDDRLSLWSSNVPPVVVVPLSDEPTMIEPRDEPMWRE